jgi:hypothetical protein
MGTKEINEWGENLTQDVYQHWLNWRDGYSFSKSGFSVFYSRPNPNPDLLILGFNPGGDESAFRKDYDSHLPPEGFHDYFQEANGDYPLAKKMRKLFEDIGKTPTLRKSVKLNLIFFRSSHVNQWKQIEKPLRQEMEKYCFRKVEEAIRILQPRFILTEGIQTFQILKSILPGTSDPKFEPGSRGRAIFAKSIFEETPLLGIIHLTGARPSNAEFQNIARYLSEELG